MYQMLASIMTIIEERDWMEPIKMFLRDQLKPNDPLELSKIKTQSTHYYLLGEDIYRRGT